MLVEYDLSFRHTMFNEAILRFFVATKPLRWKVVQNIAAFVDPLNPRYAAKQRMI